MYNLPKNNYHQNSIKPKKPGNRDCLGCGVTTQWGIDFCSNYKKWWKEQLEKMEKEWKENV